MRNLVLHAVSNHEDDILESSSLNCHAIGLHSIKIFEEGEITIRLYVVTSDHNIWRNGKVGISGESTISGYHPHHSNITIDMIKGSALNKKIKCDPAGNETLKKFLYDKSVEEKKISNGFKYIGNENVSFIENKRIDSGNYISMDSTELHDMFIEKGETAAWLVYTSKKDKNYTPHIWSNADLDQLDTSDFYKKMTRKDLYYLLELAGI